MAGSSFLKSVPRQLGAHDEAEQAESDSSQPPETFVKRPKPKARKSIIPRTSFGFGAQDEDGAEEEASGVIKAKRSNLSRVAIQRNASKRSAVNLASLPVRQPDEEDDSRPSYSAASLRELKDSTPSTPHEFATTDLVKSDSQSPKALDVASKFGYQSSSAIPSAAEIAEKKARRARLAKESAAEEYISLDPDDPNLDTVDDDENTMLDERGRLVLKPQDKYKQQESRLVRDDEDVMEGFEELTEDGRIPIGRQAEIKARQQRREDMAAQIAEAEADNDSSSDESVIAERERNAEFEAVQARHGAYENISTHADSHRNSRPRTPPEISPLPTLAGALARLRRQCTELQTLQSQKLAEVDALRREKVRLGEEEIRIQRDLKETAEKFKQMRIDKGIEVVNAESGLVLAAPAADALTPLGSSTITTNDVANDVEGNGARHGISTDSDDDSDAVSHTSEADPPTAAFDFATTRRGGLGMGRPRDEEDDW